MNPVNLIIEVMVSIVVFMTIMLGGMNYFTLPQMTITREKMKRPAVSLAQQIFRLDFGRIRKSKRFRDFCDRRHPGMSFVTPAEKGCK